jgi:2-polyprenyl-6-hydroxyphenyl methylase/3-demethylubiquinone-9 3-methyltransferase
LVVFGAAWIELQTIYGSLSLSDPGGYIRQVRSASGRGMSRWHDLVDWVGGYPFEVAKPEEIFEFCGRRGFRLQRLVTQAGGLGCNEFVFVREA